MKYQSPRGHTANGYRANPVDADAPADELMPLEELLSELNVKAYTTVWRWIKKGTFPRAQYGAGARLFWNRKIVAPFIEARRRKAAEFKSEPAPKGGSSTPKANHPWRKACKDYVVEWRKGQFNSSTR